MMRLNWAALTLHVIKSKGPEGARSSVFRDQWVTCTSEPAVWPSVSDNAVMTRPCCRIYTELRAVADGHFFNFFFFFSRCTLEKKWKGKKGKQKKNLSTGTLKRFRSFSSVVPPAWFHLQVSRNTKWVPSYLLSELQELFPVTFFQRFGVSNAQTLFIPWGTIAVIG